MTPDISRAAKGQRLILLTGASGYIGGRLLRTLHEKGERVRAIARRPDELRGSVPPDVEVVGGDVLDAASLTPAFEGIDTAYYLIHAMASDRDFEIEERAGAGGAQRRACRGRRVGGLSGASPVARCRPCSDRQSASGANQSTRQAAHRHGQAQGQAGHRRRQARRCGVWCPIPAGSFTLSPADAGAIGEEG